MSEVLGSKLSDKIRTGELGLYTGGRPLTSEMNRILRMVQGAINVSPVFYIQNVADYAYNLAETDPAAALRLDAPAFPCIAPPYPSFFTEFRFRKGWSPANAGLSRGGTLFELIDKEHLKGTLPDEVLDQTRWAMNGTTIADYPDTPPVVVSSHFLPIGENGTLVPNYSVKSGLVSQLIDDTLQIDPEHRKQILQNHYNGVMLPSLLVITFLHCKGTVVREEVPPVKLSRAIEKKSGLPLLRYHVIDVNPFQQVLSREGNVEKVGLPQALSSVRGHFADYRERGLFGREHLRGVYWKPDHERGDPSNGIIRKDYKSNIPQ